MRVITPLLGLLGVQFSLVVTDGLWGTTRQVVGIAMVTLLAAVAVCVGPVRRGLVGGMDRWRAVAGRRPLVTALCVAVGASGYLLFTAWHQGRQPRPVVPDEHCYLIQAHMLAHGRLWMPKHELSDSFDTFYMISDPVYASKYFPGTAVVLAAAIKLGMPVWTVALGLSAAAVGLFYLVLARLLDPWAGLLGAVLLVSVRMFRRLSVAYMSQPLCLVLMLAAVLAYLRWRREVGDGRRGLRWMALVGACVGAFAITRTLDAACFALPLALGIALDLRPLPRRRVVATLVIGLGAAVPFLMLQLACNRGITGRWTDTPWSYYARHDDPYDALGRRPVTGDVHTRSIVPQKRLAEETNTIPAHAQRLGTPFFQLFLHKRLQYILDDALPWTPLVALVPIGLLGLRARGRWVFWMTLPLFALAYTFHTVYLSHYVVNAAPAVIFAMLVGAGALAGAFRPAVAGAVTLLLSAVILAAALSALPEAGGARDDWEDADTMRQIDQRLAPLAEHPSVVLFRFGPGCRPLTEPVYNSDVAWPDDARVIRAHDLGESVNHRLFEYYARRDPERRVYLYDRTVLAGDPLTYLGTARELAAGTPQTLLRH
jgi:hypothetical protein